MIKNGLRKGFPRAAFKYRTRLHGFAFGAAIAVVAAVPCGPAQAGFEWTPPTHAASQEEPVRAAPAGEVEMESLAPPSMMMPENDGEVREVGMQKVVPVIEPAENAATAPAIRMPAAQQTMKAGPPDDIMKPSSASAPMQRQVIKAPAPAALNVSGARVPGAPTQKIVYQDAVGFGRDLPLALAMRQIVPPDFSFSFAAGVNQGARVTWNGGKPWNEALQDAVAPLDLDVHIVGNTVRIRHGYEAQAEGLEVPDPVMPPSEIVPPVMHATPAPGTLHTPPPVPVTQGPGMPYNNMPQNRPYAYGGQDQMPMQGMLPRSAYQQAGMRPLPEQSYPRRQPGAAMTADEQSGGNNEDAFAYNAAGQTPQAPASRMPPSRPQAPMPMKPSSMGATLQDDGPVSLAPGAAAPMAPRAYTPHAEGAAQPGMPAPPQMTEDAGRGPVMDPYEIRFWQASSGADLRSVLEQWASQANVALMWNSSYDYKLQGQIRMHGSFADAVSQILQGYNNMDPRPLGKLHPNLPEGPSVLIVEHYSSATN